MVFPRTNRSILREVKKFFVVGLGRSGTSFVAHLLNELPGCAIFHEVFSDRDALVEAYWSPISAANYLSGFRGRLISARILKTKCELYGEVNSYLRYHVDALRVLWNPKLFHLVRDGRPVVRSMMNRQTFTEKDSRHSGQLLPSSSDPFAKAWPNMDRFEKACWLWMDTNKRLLGYNLPLIRFEDITQSYEEATSQVFAPLGKNLPINRWQELVRMPINISNNDLFPDWKDWTSEQKKTFEKICGNVMHSLGYTI